MPKRFREYALILILATVLTLFFNSYLQGTEKKESEKSERQTAIENLSHRWNDLFYKLERKEKPVGDVVVLAIDEPSIIEIGRWPWSRNVINQITDQLLKYQVKTVAYDIIFSEKEGAAADTGFAKTILKAPEKLTFGTFSDYPVEVLPYQDFCLTQAFLYTGGSSLVKINPYFTVDDESNAFEELEFNRLFSPLFRIIDAQAEKTYLKAYETTKTKDLTQYQLNTLAFYKAQQVYDYCNHWLTPDDPFNYREIPELQQQYFEVFKTADLPSLEQKLSELKSKTVRNPIPHYIMWRQNIEDLQEAAQHTASFVAHPDNDGVIRNYPLIFRTGNQLGTSYIPSLALQSFLSATGYQALFKMETENNFKRITRVEILDVSGEKEKLISILPVNYEGKLLINYYGRQNTITYVSAKELLNNSPRIEYTTRVPTGPSQFTVEKHISDKSLFLKDKNIIFGATARGIYDIRAVPDDINYPGPEIHATLLSNLFDMKYLSYERYELQNAPYIFFTFILLTLIPFVRLGIRFSSMLFIAETASLIALQTWLYRQGYLFQSSLLFLILLFAAFFVTFIYKYFFQSRKSNEIKKAFSKYVSKDVVNEILKNENAIELRGQKFFMSVYFSDIRGFTEFSEKMDPVELSELLNRYFTPMSAIITQHQGTIDKYIGDAIMAMFGAPINHQNHAFQACDAALDCVEALEGINKEFEARRWPRINIGIGINTGFMNAGNIGSETIQNYTVIGDSVNLASRLEGLNKNYGTRIIISEYTYKIVHESFVCRELDRVNVKGKKEPVVIYELVSRVLSKRDT